MRSDDMIVAYTERHRNALPSLLRLIRKSGALRIMMLMPMGTGLKK
jgi:hypothetical protein